MNVMSVFTVPELSAFSICRRFGPGAVEWGTNLSACAQAGAASTVDEKRRQSAPRDQIRIHGLIPFSFKFEMWDIQLYDVPGSRHGYGSLNFDPVILMHISFWFS